MLVNKLCVTCGAISYDDIILKEGGESMQKRKSDKTKLPKSHNTLKQFQKIILFLISMTVAITTIAKNILDIFK